jgi:hypothetical protein
MAKRDAKKNKSTVTSSVELLRLHRWNSWFGIISGLEDIAILVVGSAYGVPVIINYLAVNPINSAVAGHSELSAATRQLFQVNVINIILLYFLVSAIAHGLVATVYRKSYESELKRGINKVRWIEYAISSGLMLVLIALLTGIYDLSSLIMVFAFMVLMNLLGLCMEVQNSKAQTPRWWLYGLGALAGFVPWLVIGLYAFNASYYGSAHIPSFVYGIYATMLVCVTGFALHVYFSQKKQGKWANYLHSERGFMILSLVTKSLLAWQVFAGILRP